MTARRLTILVAFVLLGACGGHRTALAHPGVTGSIDDVVAVRNDFFAERQLNLTHGALDDTVRLVRFDAEQVCFHAIMRSLETERATPDLGAPNPDLTMQANGHELAVAAVLAAPVEQTAVTGTEYVAQGTGRYETVCTETSANGSCLRYEEQEITESVAVAVDHAIRVQSSLLCFTNDGTITPHTSSVELRLGRAHFGFDLQEPGVEGASWARDPIIASGYEQFLGAAPSSGGERPVQTSTASRAPSLPADLAQIPVHAMRIADARGHVAIDVDASGTITMGNQAVAQIEGGAIVDANGVAQMALGRDGSVWALGPDHAHYVVGAEIDDRGRVRSADGTLSMQVDRHGAIVETRSTGRPRTSTASFVARLRSGDDRTLAALMMLVAHDQLTWR